MLTILHGADFHLDSPFSGLTPERAIQRRQEQRQLLERLAELAVERKADLVLLAGDLLDGQLTYRKTAQALSQSLGKIPCPVFLAPGNHDYYGPQSLYAGLDWPPNLHIFTQPTLEAVELEHLNCTVHGRAFCSPREGDSPLAGFSAPQDGRLHLMVLHAQVDGREDYAPITRQEIGASGLDYLALGHVHQYSGIRQEEGTFWAYPGCPEGRGFDETGEKGVVVVTLDKGRCEGELVPLCSRQYHIQAVDITGAADLTAAVWVSLPGEPARDIYRVTLTGTRSGESMDLVQLAHDLAPLVYGITLSDRTQVEQALWARMEEDSLTGRFLRQMALRCKKNPTDETLQQAVRFGLAALEHGEDVAP